MVAEKCKKCQQITGVKCIKYNICIDETNKQYGQFLKVSKELNLDCK